MDAIYHRTHLGDALLHALQKLCVEGELEGAEARMILADFNEVIIDSARTATRESGTASSLSRIYVPV